MVVDLKGGTYDYTGRQVSIPNSLFLTAPVHQIPRNEFILHCFGITLEPSIDTPALMAVAKEFIENASVPFIESAKEAAKSIKVKTVTDFPNPEPVVSLTTTDIGKQIIRVRWFCPLEKASQLEQELRTILITEANRGSD